MIHSYSTIDLYPQFLVVFVFCFIVVFCFHEGAQISLELCHNSGSLNIALSSSSRYYISAPSDYSVPHPFKGFLFGTLVLWHQLKTCQHWLRWSRVVSEPPPPLLWVLRAALTVLWYKNCRWDGHGVSLKARQGYIVSHPSEKYWLKNNHKSFTSKAESIVNKVSLETM